MSVEKRLTVGQIRKACKGKKYLLLRDYRLGLVGVNAGALNLPRNKNKHGNRKTTYTGFLDCDIQEYISTKIGFI